MIEITTGGALFSFVLGIIMLQLSIRSGLEFWPIFGIVLCAPVAINKPWLFAAILVPSLILAEMFWMWMARIVIERNHSPEDTDARFPDTVARTKAERDLEMDKARRGPERP